MYEYGLHPNKCKAAEQREEVRQGCEMSVEARKYPPCQGLA